MMQFDIYDPEIEARRRDLATCLNILRNRPSWERTSWRKRLAYKLIRGMFDSLESPVKGRRS